MTSDGDVGTASAPADTPGPEDTSPSRRGGRRTPRRFRDLKISRKLAVVIVVHLIHASVLLVATAYGMQALSASRAYVEGEGLWSKAEKEAVLQLNAYASTADEAHYRAFLDELNVTFGDHAARMEMDKADPDMSVIRAGFTEGRLAPKDFGNMVWLYRNFGREPHLAAAVTIWRQADENITLLLAKGQELHAAVTNEAPGSLHIATLLEEVYAMDQRLTGLEDDFSRTLGDGARWLTVAVTAGAIGLTVLFVGGAFLISTMVAHQITRSVAQLKAGAQDLSSGHPGARVRVDNRDELGLAAAAFNDMADRLERLHQQEAAGAVALRESLERFSVLAEGAPLGIYHTTPKGVVDYANQRWMEMAGCDYHDFDAIRAAVHDEDRERLKAQWRTALSGGTDLIAEFRYVHRDGKVVDCLTRGSPVRDPSGRITGFVGVVEDVTQRRVSESKAREAQRLKEQSEFKTTFMNTAAHELNTPLTPLALQVFLLRQSLSPSATPEQLHSLEIVDRNLKRLNGLVKDLLDGARLESGHFVLRRKDVDMPVAVHSVVQELRAVAADRGILLAEEPVPPVHVDADPDRLQQVLLNLIGNALKFTPRGGRVVVAGERTETELTVHVMDSGIGLTGDDIAKLFRPFSQVHDPVRVAVGGTGLGLYICKGIIEAHGGRIWVESMGLGHGADFVFALPILPRTSTAAPLPAQSVHV